MQSHATKRLAEWNQKIDSIFAHAALVVERAEAPGRWEVDMEQCRKTFARNLEYVAEAQTAIVSGCKWD